MTNVTDKEIDTIAQTVMNATKNADSGRTSYLQTLLMATQTDLEHKKGLDAPLQLAALKRVHERFYAIVLSAAGRIVPKNRPQRAEEMQRLANFARTALSALRGHVRADGDLCALAPAKVTKGALRTRAGPAQPPSPERLKATAERESKRLVATLMGLADTDKQAAVAEIQLIMGQLADQLLSLGVVATKDAARAASKGIALRINKTLFMPTNTQVLAARPM
jgi:hypothetical protein